MPAGSPEEADLAGPNTRSEERQLISGRYIVEREVGVGGFAVVYFARDQQLANKRVVLKCIPAAADRNSWYRKRFLKEIEALSRIEHPGVIEVLDTGALPDGTPFLVTPFIEGETLQAVIEQSFSDLGRAARLLRQISSAVEAAHAVGIAHRDIKPANIMVQSLAGGEEHIKLIDFGIAEVPDPEHVEKTRTLVVSGTIDYMAPEQLMGDPNKLSDIYSLGLIAYEMVTGRKPFQDTSPSKLYAAQAAGVPVPPRFFRPSLPSRAEAAILKALAFRPEERYQSAVEFGDAVFESLTASAENSWPDDTQNARLEIAQVVFMDVEGFSVLATDQQRRLVDRLQQIVRSTRQFGQLSGTEQLIRIPTGDGMALAFFDTPLTAVLFAVDIAERLRNDSDLKVRIGINAGAVFRVRDINGNVNIAGEGINFAQRVMDCGDAGHILITKTVADVLLTLSDWKGCVRDLGEMMVKHGVSIHVYSLVTERAGNPAPPQRLKSRVHQQSRPDPSKNLRWPRRAVLALSAAGAGIGSGYLLRDRFFGGPVIHSLAVLPFANTSQGAEFEYLSDGLTEALINQLAALHEVRIMSRNAVFRFKNSDADPQAVGKQLAVEAVLTGRILVRGDRLTVTAELIGTETNEHLWGQHYNRKLAEAAAVQEDIAQEIANKLRARLTPRERTMLARRETNDSEAYQLYMRGLFHWNKRTQEDLRAAIDYFERATARDSRYAKAWVGLANCYSFQAGARPPNEIYPLARNAARRAVEIDEDLAEAQNALAVINLYYDWNWLETEKRFRRALQLNPSYPSGHSLFAMYLIAMKRFDEAYARMQRALQLDPASLPINTGVGRVHFFARRYSEAENQLLETIRMDPRFPEAHFDLGRTYLWSGRYADALRHIQIGLETVKQNAGALAHMVIANVRLGRSQEAESCFKGLEELQKRYYVSPCFTAIAKIGFGDIESALDHLEAALEQRSWLMIMLDVEPAYDEFRQHSRFQSLRRSVGLA